MEEILLQKPTDQPRLVLDVFALIIKQFRHDKISLKDHALVCRDWLRFSRPLLFRHIRLSKMFLLSRTDHLSIFCSPECTIFPHVCSIVFAGIPAYGQESRYDAEAWMDDFCSQIHRFSSLKHIEILFLNPNELSKLRISLDSVREQITTLTIDNTLFKTTQDVASFVSFFPSLHTLSVCRRPRFNLEYTTGSALPQPPRRLRKLCVTNTYGITSNDINCDAGLDTFAFRWLRDSSSKLDALDISLVSRNPMVLTAMTGRLSSIGQSITEMKVVIMGDDAADMSSDLVAASKNLRHIYICCRGGSSVSYSYGSRFICLPMTCVPIFHALPSTIQTISVEMDVQLWSASKSYDYYWDSADKLLSGDRFPDLKDIAISFQHVSGVADAYISNLWPRILPLCYAKRNMRVFVRRH